MPASFLSLIVASLLVTPALADVTIGVAAGMTGPDAAFGEQIRHGVEMAVADINAAGGMNGERLSNEVADDVDDPKQAVTVANRFVGDQVKFVVGHVASSASIPASEVYAEHGILEVSPSSTNVKYTDRGLWNTFRSCGRDDQQAVIAAHYILKTFPKARIAILHDKTVGGEGLALAFKKLINAAGLTNRLFTGINPGEKDISAIITRMKAEQVDIVYYGGFYTDAGLILRQAGDQGYKVKLMAADGIATSDFPSVAGPNVEGTLMTFGPDPRRNPKASGIVQEFRAAGFEPESYTLYAYAGVQIIAAGANATKSNDPKVIAEWLHAGHTVETVLGPIVFDKKGDRTDSGYIVYEWRRSAEGKLSYEPVEN